MKKKNQKKKTICSGVLSSRWFKTSEQCFDIYWKIDIKASSRKCDFTFFKKNKTIIKAGLQTPKLDIIRGEGM